MSSLPPEADVATVMSMLGLGPEAAVHTSVAVELSNMTLGIELEAYPRDEVDLGFQKVNVLFLIVHELLKQISRHVVLDQMAMGRGFAVEGVRRQFGFQVAIEHGLHGLPDMKGFQRLHIGRSIEEDDAFDELVSMLHLFDRFLAPRLGQLLVAPIVEQAVVQPVLVHRGELVTQRVIEVFDSFLIALHALLLFASAGFTRTM